jgi:hypothetical protein
MISIASKLKEHGSITRTLGFRRQYSKDNSASTYRHSPILTTPSIPNRLHCFGQPETGSVSTHTPTPTTTGSASSTTDRVHRPLVQVFRPHPSLPVSLLRSSVPLSAFPNNFHSGLLLCSCSLKLWPFHYSLSEASERHGPWGCYG